MNYPSMTEVCRDCEAYPNLYLYHVVKGIARSCGSKKALKQIMNYEIDKVWVEKEAKKK